MGEREILPGLEYSEVEGGIGTWWSCSSEYQVDIMVRWERLRGYGEFTSKEGKYRAKLRDFDLQSSTAIGGR